MGKLGKIFYFLAALSILFFAVIRFLLGAWIPFLWVMLGLFVGFIAAAFWVDRDYYNDFLGTKTTKQGMSMGAMIALVLVFLIAVNFIAVRKYTTFDFSLAKVNTLSDQSIKLVKGLTNDLRVYYFYKNGTEGVEANRRGFIDLIRKYQDQSDRVKLEFVEVNERPDLAEKFKVQQGSQVVILDYQERQNRIEKIDEQELTSAIVKVTRTSSKKVYLLSGHQELTTEYSKDGSSISLLKELLTNNRYTVADHSFTKTTQVPADADILIIPGPKMNFLDVEVKAIEEFLNRGGSVILTVKSGIKTGLESVLKNIGVVSKGNYIATVLQTPLGTAVDPRFARGSVFSSGHQITKPLANGNLFSMFRLPTALVKIDPPPAGISIDEFVRTNESVMGFKDTNFKNAGEKGPFTLAMAIKGKYTAEAKNEFNLLVFGDSDFMNDEYLYKNVNRDLMLNSVAFLAKEENLISITPKEVMTTDMVITETQFALFLFGFIIPLPLLLFVSSGVMWYRRRYS